MSPVLEAEGLQTYYGKSHILHGVSLNVQAGELVALLGRNGAGKTTTMRSVMGLTPPREGQVRIFGRDVTKAPAYRIARAGVGYVPEGRKIFGHMTVHENLLVPPDRPGPWTIATIYKLFPRLDERRTSKGGKLSGGEQEMLAIARALLLNPRFLILDEPSQGLAPVIVQEVMRMVARVKGEGTAILLVEQNAFLALQLADRAYVLSDGEVVYDGSAAELAADTARMKSLAGVSHGA
jgi:branched-chain amino acid transport system ATP-binding protein